MQGLTHRTAQRRETHAGNSRSSGGGLTALLFVQYYATPASRLPAGAARLSAKRLQQLLLKFSQQCSSVQLVLSTGYCVC